MFQVCNKDNDKKYTVYDIRYNSSGTPYFLVYENGIWELFPASYFIPAEEPKKSTVRKKKELNG